MEKSIHSVSASQTQQIAKVLAREALLRPRTRGALVFALKGELGTGKTTFVQGFAKGLGAKERIASPTFLIVRHYKLQAKNYKLFWHIDCYRLKNPKELVGLGWKEITADPQNIVAVEWAENVRRILPKDAIWLSFSHAKQEKTIRTIKFNAT